MKINTKKLITLVFLVFVLNMIITTSAEAKISLGSVTGMNHAEVEPGDSVELKILLFNIHESSTMIVDLNVESKPDGWNVRIEPERIELPYTIPSKYVDQESGYEYLSVPNTGEMIKVMPVVASVNVPSNAVPGEYFVNIVASARKTGGVLSAAQRRNFDFTVRILDESYDHQTKAKSNNIPMGGLYSDPETEKTNKLVGDEIINKTEEKPDENVTNIIKTDTEERPDPEPLSGITGMMISSSSVVAVFMWLVVIIVIIKVRRSR